MFFFGKNNRRIARQDAEIKAIHRELYKRIAKVSKNTEDANKTMDKLNEILDDNSVTGMIFLATGGDRRIK